MKKILLVALATVFYFGVNAQNFESTTIDTCQSDKVKVHVGGDFALQFQSLTQHADSTDLIPLGNGINLPTANLNLNVHLAPGIKLNLTTYLASRHHEDTWVKGGYLSINQLPFLNSEFFKEHIVLMAGMSNINYGDEHFRRSDNGSVLNNPFVGNYVMDAFTTNPFVEAYFNYNGILVMGGVTTGTLKNTLVAFNSRDSSYTTYNMFENLAYYAKVGYDKQLNDNLRVRLTASYYTQKQNYFGSLYNGSRTGSRFYLVMNPITYNATDVDITSNHLDGNWGPGFLNKDNSMMVNLFVKFHGLELFGTYENVKGTGQYSGADLNFSQLEAELLYRFGGQEQFYLGGKYNMVNDDQNEKIVLIEGVAGWNLTKNIVMKLDYVNQSYTGFTKYGPTAGFKGLMFEAGISF